MAAVNRVRVARADRVGDARHGCLMFPEVLDPVPLISTCLRIALDDFRRQFPYPWHAAESPLDGESGDRGVWFTAGEPAIAALAVFVDSVVVFPARASSDRGGTASAVDLRGGLVAVDRDDADLARLLSASLRSMSESALRSRLRMCGEAPGVAPSTT